MIPEEAVEVAVDALVGSKLGDHPGINAEEFVEAARAALEAAAPYIQAASFREAGDGLEYGNPIGSWLHDRAEALESEAARGNH